MSTDDLRHQLGPLAPLVGVWEGAEGHDIAPSPDRGTASTPYRERTTFDLVGEVRNHEQSLGVLRYATRAWRIGAADAFHEEVGYWSWEPGTGQVLRCFLVPRGISLIAAGDAGPEVREFTLSSEAGSCTQGICTNPFLDREFKILSYEVTVRILDDDTFAYDQDTVLRIAGRPEPFHHRDRNTLRRA